jgi:hypothetical protein
MTSLLHLNIGPSKWFQTIMKESLLTGYALEKDPIMSSLLYTMQLSQNLAIKKKARVLVQDTCKSNQPNPSSGNEGGPLKRKDF